MSRLGAGAAYGRPLVSLDTYRRGVFLFLGAVLLLPYLLWVVASARAVGTGGWRTGLLPLLILVAAGGSAPFLGVLRSLEVAAARLLLDADLPATPSESLPREARLRSALWFALHLASGGLVGALTLAGVPLTYRVGVWAVPVYTVVLVYVVAACGSLARAMAPVLLGPSAADQAAARVAAAEAEMTKLAERNRIARDLHDSIGHALTATTLQAAAAQRVFDTDPEFARRALTTIAEVGRAAAADLDRALGVLRGDDPPDEVAPDLTRLGQLCANVRDSGVALNYTETGPLADVPAAVSRESYRIVQEGLTNAVRHAGPGEVTLSVGVTADTVRIELTNPVAAGRTRGAGRGLASIRERTDLLGGTVERVVADGRWRLAVCLPRSAPR